jgi:hypothetical protein
MSQKLLRPNYTDNNLIKNFAKERPKASFFTIFS